MTTQTPTRITITDRNEAKALCAWGFTGTPSPRNSNTLDFEFEATDALFEARRSYSLNHSIPVLSFIAASHHIDAQIHSHRNIGGRI